MSTAHDVPGTFLPQLRFKQRTPDIGSGAHIFAQFLRTAPIPFSLGLRLGIVKINSLFCFE
jgi:hypothetical protein